MKKNKNIGRRSFVQMTGLASLGVASYSFAPIPINSFVSPKDLEIAPLKGKRVGIIGLDTSHSEVFTRMINSGEVSGGYKVVAAYPHGSADIPEALKMKPGITKAVMAMGVEIVDSIETLLEKVDVVLLETIDGRPHYEQALPVLKSGKPMFIDKPLAADLADAEKIYAASRKYKSPIFSSSALRYDQKVQEVVNGAIGKVTGADVYTPAVIEPHHMDLAWYGIHGVEMLFTVMGPGCKEVSRVYREGTDLVTGVWDDGRIGTVRGIRAGASNIAGTAFGEKGISPLGPFSSYVPLVESIITFFNSGIPPVSELETLEIFKFMHAADLSRKRNGKTIKLT
ncbi:Inositol 2-dehydrogenase/D-chiro-inositol 3-dehydrogenase [Arenibacter antarcticus]|uniref:Gfo/Idh/MocA family protein n=1 Tax=Arenibacter antarcticus TaxID=2040469 RepID=A0ABW5VGN7_9FLAO|nr:Gfo/Idh/MocA family oxidoreductase [Arenibacter sp. H213]MCM4167110.1 dehydrogenase [Arenibacter sp. H213]